MDPTPATQELLDAATRWHSLSWWGLIAFGLGTVAFTFIQFWSSGLLDRHTEWRTKNLERETAQANESAALANKRAAELQKEAQVAKLEQERLRQQLAWRRLDATQMQKLVGDLTGITFPVTLQVEASDPEAALFAADIAEAFQSAGILFERKTAIVFGAGPIFGLRIHGREDEMQRIGTPFQNIGIDISGFPQDSALVFHVASKPPPKQ